MARKQTKISSHLFDAVIFDMDGVITKTARVHAEAWKWAFDRFLKERAAAAQDVFQEFKPADYLRYVDGKPRLKGIASFLKSRKISIPQGAAHDEPSAPTVHGIGNNKNARFLEIIQTRGVKVYEPVINLVHALRQEGIHRAVVTSSGNCSFILKSARVTDLFETRVDGHVARKLNLAGKPESDIFVYAARLLEVSPGRCVVVEDAISGVQAGRNGAFGLVLGVARSDNIADLCCNGADVVITVMSAIDISWIDKWMKKSPAPLFTAWDAPALVEQPYRDLAPAGSSVTMNPLYRRTPQEIFSVDRRKIFFLDYDGTLTPIVGRPDLAVMSEEMRAVVRELARKHTVAVVSGRQREDVEQLVRLENIFYAGSHGFDIRGPGFSLVQPQAAQAIPVVAELIADLKRTVQAVEGVLIEEKKYSVAVHYRQVAPEAENRVQDAVLKLVRGRSEVRVLRGKKVLEILPQIDWNKGKAIRWIMSALQVSFADAVVAYVGDDTTDEDAFRMIRTRGVGILVAEEARPSAADFRVDSPEDVCAFFRRILAV